MALGAEEEGVLLSDVTGFGAIGGRGVTGAVDGIEVVWVPPSCSPIGFVVPVLADRMAEIESEGATAFLGGWDGEEGDDRCCRHAP